jgi:AcrR family transcriptional regulator
MDVNSDADAVERGGAARSTKAEQSETTRSQLVAVARALFAERGYAAVGTEEIVRTAGVTRGALYHHFKDKKDLFAAVYEAVERELVEQITASAVSESDTSLQALHAGAQAFLDACENNQAVQRIALLDAPSVLGWEQWREIGMRYGFGLIQATVQEAMDAGLIEPQDVRSLSHLLLGALDEGAMLVARADDAGETRKAVGHSMTRLLEALVPRTEPGP